VAKPAKVAEKAQSQWAERLAQGNKAWKDAPTGGFKDCEPGRFTFMLEEAVLFESKSKQELMLRLKWVVAKGEHKGDQVTEFFSLDNEDRYPMLKARITDLGFEVPETKSDIEDLAAELNREPPIIVADVVKSKPNENGMQFTNLRNVTLIDDAALASEAVAEAEAEAEGEGEAEAVTEEAEAEAETEEPAALVKGARVTFADDEGDEHSAKVVSVDDDAKTARVKDDEGAVWDVNQDALTIEGAEAVEAEEVVEEASGDDEEAAQKAALLTIADAHDVEVSEDDDLADIVKKMRKAVWKDAELGDDEVETLEAAGLKVVKASKPAAKPAKPVAKAAVKPAVKKAKR